MAQNPKARLSDLQVANFEELRILVCCGVHHENESLIHHHLRGEWIRGEWFRPTERALALVEAMRRNKEDPQSHLLTDYIYKNDFEAVVWFRKRSLGFEIFGFEKPLAEKLGLRLKGLIRPSPPMNYGMPAGYYGTLAG